MSKSKFKWFEGKVTGKITHKGFFWTSYEVAVKLKDFKDPMSTKVSFAEYCSANVGDKIRPELASDDGGKHWHYPTIGDNMDED